LSENTVDRLKGQYCKIVINEPGKKKASVIFGYLKDVDHKKNFVIIESSNGLGIINKKTIVAIKPSKRKNNSK
jgi:hypothetical protein